MGSRRARFPLFPRRRWHLGERCQRSRWFPSQPTAVSARGACGKEPKEPVGASGWRQDQPMAAMPVRRVGLGSAALTLRCWSVCTRGTWWGEHRHRSPRQWASPAWFCPTERLDAGQLQCLQNVKTLWISAAALYRFTHFRGWTNTRLSLQTFIMQHGKWDQRWQILEICVLF